MECMNDEETDAIIHLIEPKLWWEGVSLLE